MIPNLYIFSREGCVLFEKHWVLMADKLCPDIIWEDISHHGSVTSEEIAPLVVFEFQRKVMDLSNDYCNNNLNESMLKDNFSVIYQLLDELVDGGFPSTTEPNHLKEVVPPQTFTQSVKRTFSKKGSNVSDSGLRPSTTIPWRSRYVKYVTNEIYFDITETVNYITTCSGKLISSEIHGSVLCSSKLSGMPDVTLTLSDPHVLQACSLHRCVRINRLKKTRAISFVPPDGNFVLFSYTSELRGTTPISVSSNFRFSVTTAEVDIVVRSQVHTSKLLSNVYVEIPFSTVVLSTSLSCSSGIVVYDDQRKLCRWNIPKLANGKIVSLSGVVRFSSTDSVEMRSPTFRVGFTMKQIALSGLKVNG
eukprot:210873_1